MSVVYYVKETLNVRNTEAFKPIIERMCSQYSVLGTLMLASDARVDDMNLVADGEAYCFSGEEATPELGNLIDAMKNAKRIHFNASYEYCWRETNDALDSGPFAACDCAEELIKSGKVETEEFLYTAYNEADCGDGAGCLCAYGEKDGRKYCGAVEPKIVEEFPESRCWQAAVCPVLCCTVEDDTPETEQAFVDACLAFDANASYSIDKYDGWIDFELDDVGVIKTKEDFNRFVTLYKELYRLSGGDVSLIGELVDDIEKIPKILMFNIDENGNCKFELISI